MLRRIPGEGRRDPLLKSDMGADMRSPACLACCVRSVPLVKVPQPPMLPGARQLI